ncbi:MAG: class I SAM-dependent methyltransferase [Planctomycetaceae bacterium]|nr:class I SAM-dependent methyltransferase [Planctomycetaceae bacterium]
MPTHLVLHNGVRATRYDSPTPTTEHDVVVTNLPYERLLHYTIEQQGAGGIATTLEFELDTHFNFSTPVAPADDAPFDDEESSKLFADAALQILNRTGIDQGICLVVGHGSGRLAWELVHRSRLRVIGVDTDPAAVAAARKAFLTAGIYGGRVAVHYVESYDKLPFVGRFANLIVSESFLTGDDSIGHGSELFRVLRPNGGRLCLGRIGDLASPDFSNVLTTSLTAAGLPVKFDAGPIDNHPLSVWMTAMRPPLEGAGEWSHLYGRADNSAFGGEELGGASTTSEMLVQWIGHPGPRAQPDRNGRKPSPLSTNARLFVQGLHRVIAVDAFNGTVLWSLEIPPLERFNMPRDCSNWCADDEFLYLAIRDKCWRIDAANGELAAFHPVVTAERKDWSYDWGYVAQVAGHLLGSAVKSGSAFTSYWGDDEVGWYDARSGPATFKVCGDLLFAAAKDSGKRPGRMRMESSSTRRSRSSTSASASWNHAILM